MNEEILDQLPYGVVVCKNDGTMLYLNSKSASILRCETSKPEKYNILSSIDNHFQEKVKQVLQNPELCILTLNQDYIFFKLKDISSKVYKMKFKSYNNNILMMIYDYTSAKLDRDHMVKTITQMNENIVKNNLILKCISDICKNVFYKNRSDGLDILGSIASSFHLIKAAVCFKNGTNHLMCVRKLSNGKYEQLKLEGKEVPKYQCNIWKDEKNFKDCKELILQAPCKDTCADLLFNGIDYSNQVMHILKLKLGDNKIVGFLEFIEDNDFRLSTSDLEILESLSQILAYIINNKEEIADVTNYIKQQFEKISGK